MACSLSSHIKYKNPIVCGRIFLYLITPLSFVYPFILKGQHIDNQSFLTNFNEQKALHVHYDNDLFRGTDYYYTQGLNVLVKYPGLKKNPINRVLIGVKGDTLKQYAIGLESASYTPTNILSDTILSMDRPFAAATSFAFTKYARNNNRRYFLSSQLNLGMIGPAVLGKEIQTGIHKVTKNAIPHGWEYQIQNDFLLNYKLTFEKQLIQYRNFFGVSSLNQLNIGTFQTNVTTGFNCFLGIKEPLFDAIKPSRFQFYIYSQSYFRLVFHDASLMGGVFNRSSELIYNYNQINPFLLEQHLGLCLKMNRFSVMIDLGFLTRELRIGSSHSWGGLKLIFFGK